MTAAHNALTITRHGRTIIIARINDADRYQALIAYKVSPAVASAVTANLCYIRVKG